MPARKDKSHGTFSKDIETMDDFYCMTEGYLIRRKQSWKSLPKAI